MKKLLFIILATSLLFFSCEKESGELFDDSASKPVYSHEVLKKEWVSEIEFLSEYSNFVARYTLVDNIILIRTGNQNLHAVSADTGELLWVKNRQGITSFSLEDICLIEDQIYMLASVNGRPALAILDKSTGQLLETRMVSDLIDIDGHVYLRNIFDDKLYLGVEKPNGNFFDRSDFSLFIYEYDLQTQSLNLLFEDEKIFSQYHESIGRAVVNEEGTSIFFQYLKQDDDNLWMLIVEIPFDGSSPKLVIEDLLEIKQHQISSLRNQFVVKGNKLIISFQHVLDYKLRAYDLVTGQLVWKRKSNFFIEFNKGNLFALNGQFNTRFEHIDYQNGNTLYRQNIGANGFRINFFDNKNLASCISGNIKTMSILDLNSGSILVSISLEDLGYDAHQNYFPGKAYAYDNEEKIIVVTYRGQVFSLRHPF